MDNSLSPTAKSLLHASLQLSLGVAVVQVQHQKGQVVQANQTLCDLFGLTRKTIQGVCFSDFAVDKEEFRKLTEPLLTGQVQQLTVNKHRFQNNQGADIWLHLEMTVLQEEHDPQVICYVIDVTEQVQDHAALQQAIGLQKALASNIPDVTIYMLDTDMRYVAVEGARSGDAAGVLVGKTLYELDLVAAKQKAQLLEIFKTASLGQESEELEMIFDDQILSIRAVPVMSAVDGTVDFIIAVARDITKMQQAMARLDDLAHYDSLTKLPNREYFHQKLALCLQEEKAGALMMLDLNGFKSVNDTYGHDAGDALLKLVAQRLKQAIGSNHFAARLGGDEFTVLLEDTEQIEVQKIADQIILSVQQPVVLGGNSLSIGPSIGIATLGRFTADQLIKQADLAMYQAKSQKESCWRQFRCTEAVNFQGLDLT